MNTNYATLDSQRRIIRGKFKDLHTNLYFLKQIQTKHQLKGKSMNLISNKDEIKQLQGTLQEIADAMLQISSHQERIKEIKANALENHKDKLTAKQLNRLAKTYFKSNYSEVIQDAEQFQYLYETIVGIKDNE